MRPLSSAPRLFSINSDLPALLPNLYALQTVLGYKGALGGSLVVIVFPAWMYFGLTQRRLAAAAAASAAAGGAGAVADWAVRGSSNPSPSSGSSANRDTASSSSLADDKTALLLADGAAAAEGALAPSASGVAGVGVPLGELRWTWGDLIHTRHGLLAAAGSVLGLALMVSGTLAASHLI